LKRALHFYKRTMEMRESLRGKMEHGGIWVELKSPGSAQRLELNYYPPRSKFFEKFRIGSELDHLAFWVKDVDKQYERLLANGARRAVAPFSDHRYRFAFVRDPDGIWIELIGRDKRRIKNGEGGQATS